MRKSSKAPPRSKTITQASVETYETVLIITQIFEDVLIQKGI